MKCILGIVVNFQTESKQLTLLVCDWIKSRNIQEEAFYSEEVSYLPVFPFLAVEGGRVFIRDWRDRKSSRMDTKRKPVAPGALKTRPCWFHEHHPQRCPLQDEDCAFAHGPDDLRPSTRPLKKMKNDVL